RGTLNGADAAAPSAGRDTRRADVDSPLSEGERVSKSLREAVEARLLSEPDRCTRSRIAARTRRDSGRGDGAAGGGGSVFVSTGDVGCAVGDADRCWDAREAIRRPPSAGISAGSLKRPADEGDGAG